MKAPSKRVLIIDDEAVHREMLEVLLGDVGVEVTACTRATEALSLLRDGKKFDLILSDVVMPGMDGLTFAKEARKVAPAIPVILVTGRDSAVDTMLAEGIVAIVKPYTAQTLRTLVAQHLEISEWDVGKV